MFDDLYESRQSPLEMAAGNLSDAEGSHQIVKPRPKFERKSVADRFTVGYALYSPSTQDYEVSKNYGADISTLARLIEAGEL